MAPFVSSLSGSKNVYLDYTQSARTQADILVEKYGLEQARKITKAQVTWVSFCYAQDPQCISSDKMLFISEVKYEVCRRVA